MTSIHFVGGEKGGEGRSFVCRALIDYHRVRQMPSSVFDTCRSYSDVSRFYRDIKECEAKGFGHKHSLSEIASDIFEKELDGSVIVNLHTHGMKQMIWPWIEEAKDERIAELQSHKATIWFVSIGSGDSYRLLEESLDYFGGRVRHILVKNLWERSFWRLDRVHEKFDRISRERNLSVVDFPDFPEGKALDLILEKDVPYLEAQRHSALPRICQNRTSIFLKKAFAAFESANAV